MLRHQRIAKQKPVKKLTTPVTKGKKRGFSSAANDKKNIMLLQPSKQQNINAIKCQVILMQTSTNMQIPFNRNHLITLLIMTSITN
eukprot:UN04228